MPVGKVKWYDPERGFGFLGNPGSEDVFVNKAVLPEGVEELYKGQRVDFDFVAGRRGPQALRVAVLETPGRKPQRKYSAEQLNSIIADMLTVMETKVQPKLLDGRYPERKEAKQIAEILRVIAKELDV